MGTGRRALVFLFAVAVIVSPVAGAAQTAPRAPQPASGAKVNWKQAAGTTLNVVMVPHPYTEALKAQVPEFEALTGMKVNITALPYNQAADKILADLTSGQAQFDVIFSAYPWDWQFGSFYAPIDDYLNDPSLTDKEWYNFGDFMPLIVESARWNRVPGASLGNGPLLNIPVMVETYILAYRKDLLTAAGVKVPETWEEFFDAARKLTQVRDGRQVYGLIARGNKGLGPLMTNVILMYKSHGLTDFNEKLESVINTPLGVTLTDKYLQTVKAAAPPGWPEVVWDDALHRFAAGDYAMIHDVDFGAQTYESPAASKVAGKVAYALPPAGPQGRVSNIWAWGLALNKASKQAKAGWLLIQWATSESVLLEATVKHRNFNPPRLSVWNHPQVVAMIKDWGGGTYRPAAQETLLKYAKLRWTPEPQVSQMAAIWMEELQKAYAGQQSTKQGLDNAASRINAVMQRLGIQRR